MNSVPPVHEAREAFREKNAILEETILRICEGVSQHPSSDKRWAAIAFTKVQEAFMALDRAIINKPRLKLEGDQNEVPQEASGD